MGLCVFIVNFKHTSLFFLLLIFLTFNMYLPAGKSSFRFFGPCLFRWKYYVKAWRQMVNSRLKKISINIFRYILHLFRFSPLELTISWRQKFQVMPCYSKRCPKPTLFPHGNLFLCMCWCFSHICVSIWWKILREQSFRIFWTVPFTYSSSKTYKITINCNFSWQHKT